MTVSQFERDLQIARQIQASFLPDKLLQPDGWQIAAWSQPASQVGGDFYDVFPLVQGRRLGLIIADVCDKGVGAALYMALFRTLLRAFAGQHYSLRWTDVLSDDAPLPVPGGARRELPAIGTTPLYNAVRLTNDYIAQTHESAHMFATLFFGVLCPVTGALAYINGGHEPPIIVGPTGPKATLMPTGPIVGIFPESDYAIQHTQLEPGDCLVAVTDGVTEAQTTAGDLFTSERLHDLLAQPLTSAQSALERIQAAVAEHVAGAEQSDDITILAVRRLPTSGDLTGG